MPQRLQVGINSRLAIRGFLGDGTFGSEPICFYPVRTLESAPWRGDAKLLFYYDRRSFDSAAYRCTKHGKKTLSAKRNKKPQVMLVKQKHGLLAEVKNEEERIQLDRRRSSDLYVPRSIALDSDGHHAGQSPCHSMFRQEVL